MNFRVLCVGLLLMMVLLGTARAQDLFDSPWSQSHKLWYAPARLYGLTLPRGWQALIDEKDPSLVRIVPSDGSDVYMVVRRVRVPVGASARQLLLNDYERWMSKLPSFREIERRDVTISSLPASLISGNYYYQGNAQYPRVVEALYVVKHDEAFAITFDSFAVLAAQAAPALDLVYKSFVIRPQEARSGPAKAPLDLGRILR